MHVTAILLKQIYHKQSYQPLTFNNAVLKSHSIAKDIPQKCTIGTLEKYKIKNIVRNKWVSYV